MSKKATAGLAAREAARARLAQMNADRAQREAAVIDAAAEYAARTDEQDDLRSRMAALDAARGRALTAIVDNGETNPRAAELVGITSAEVVRLRKAAVDSAGGAGSGQV